MELGYRFYSKKNKKSGFVEFLYICILFNGFKQQNNHLKIN
jgi:hypothetical protein